MWVQSIYKLTATVDTCIRSVQDQASLGSTLDELFVAWWQPTTWCILTAQLGGVEGFEVESSKIKVVLVEEAGKIMIKVDSMNVWNSLRINKILYWKFFV